MARELTALGEHPRIDDGGVSWTGDARSMMRANLWLRAASRVLVRVARFEARTFRELERHANTIDWSRFLAAGITADFRVTARKSKLYHSDGIADRLLSATRSRSPAGKAARPEPGAGSREQLFVVRVVRDQFEISVDTSGELLHVRGYRQAVAKAPLRETLAAALLLGAGWTGDTPLVDPLCGSGTIAIEGALIARRIAPGIARAFAFQSWPRFEATSFDRERADARAGVLAQAPAPIAGSDRDAGAIESSIANAARAGVADAIDWSVRSISALAPPQGPGLIATNPPYGKRVGTAGDVRNLYAQLGKVVRRHCRGWRLALYSPSAGLTSQLALPSSELFRTSNGGIRVSAVAAEVA